MLSCTSKVGVSAFGNPHTVRQCRQRRVIARAEESGTQVSSLYGGNTSGYRVSANSYLQYRAVAVPVAC